MSGGAWAGTIVFAFLFAVGLFFLLPAGLTNLFSRLHPQRARLRADREADPDLDLPGYLWLISRMPDLQRVFQYHGAEHKTISCYEAGEPLTPENAERFSRLHRAAGRSSSCSS